LPNAHILIGDENNNRVIEVTRAHQIVWHLAPHHLRIGGAAFASRLLGNGDTLRPTPITAAIVEVNSLGHVVWQYFTDTQPGSLAQPLPTRGVRLKGGNTLISNQNDDPVIEVTAGKRTVFAQGMIGVAGTGFDELNSPYDAKVVGGAIPD
jgi:allophanate hydrolase subunit 2